MGFLRVLPILILFILLGGVQEPGLVEAFFLRQCPRNRVRCEIQERDLCTNSRDCPKKMKCCMFSCGKKCLDVSKDVCTLPKVPGPCNAFFVRWWYDQQKEICSSFIYGGCQGNNNNFQSEGVCRAICPRRTHDLLTSFPPAQLLSNIMPFAR
ncbi:hypothetical protein FD755_004769 [Muntiacus reevesi]|uniref:BPTI/Kunitz inhibitor domain-containing protein n=1 Tax=Muntiacus reevesi TaxID=9886 RepID=A0A5J5MTT1_MUNRE|nr:hypothetical protein FD755_004769 [Muntiacus reevesi]